MLNGNQNRTIDLLINLAKEKNYDGWDLDFENVAKGDKDLYNTFSKKFSEKLHTQGLLLSITVQAQESDNAGNITPGQDIETLGKYADQIRVMAYDFHSPSSAPGPITPITDLEKTITYTKSKIDLTKIIISLPTYGYDWSNDGPATAYQYQELQSLLSLKNAKSTRDIDSQEVNATYNNHQVWYPDSTSLSKLIEITKAFGIDKICFWHIGGEDINMWGKI